MRVRQENGSLYLFLFLKQEWNSRTGRRGAAPTSGAEKSSLFWWVIFVVVAVVILFSGNFKEHGSLKWLNHFPLYLT